MISFIAAAWNCANAQGRVCRIQPTCFWGNIFPFFAASLDLPESVIFRKKYFPLLRQTCNYTPPKKKSVVINEILFSLLRQLEIALMRKEESVVSKKTSFCGKLNKLRERVIFRKYIFLYCDNLEIAHKRKVECVVSNQPLIYEIYFFDIAP